MPLLFIVFVLELSAQDQKFEIPKPGDLVIPASPAFQMINANTTMVNSPGAIRDYKVDWSFKTYRLSPNLSIEAQPVYTIFYNRPTPVKYQNAGKFMQTLSTLSISAASLDFNDSIRLFSSAGKITLWRGYDPLASDINFQDINKDFMLQDSIINSEINDLKIKYANSKTRVQKDSAEFALNQANIRLEQMHYTQKTRIKQRQDDLKTRFWNSGAVDLAFGKSYSFNRTLSDQVKEVKLKNTGVSVWLNASQGLGRRVLISTIAKMDHIKMDIPDSQKVKVSHIFIDPNTNDTSFIEVDSLSLSISKGYKNNLSAGLNIRYGTPTFMFFVECFLAKSQIFSFEKSDWKDEYSLKTKTGKLKPNYIIAFGGEWRLHNNLLLSFGIRNTIDDKLKFRSLIPLASITCLMR